MIKKKGKRKTTAKKAAKKQSAPKSEREMNPAEVRKDIAKLVEAEAQLMAKAVIDEGKKGQLAPVKYLFEMAHIFPEPPEGSQSTTEEDSLAKTLLDRLNIPDTPVVHDQYEKGEDVIVIPPRSKGEDKNQEGVKESSEEDLEVTVRME